MRVSNHEALGAAHPSRRIAVAMLLRMRPRHIIHESTPHLFGIASLTVSPTKAAARR